MFLSLRKKSRLLTYFDRSIQLTIYSNVEKIFSFVLLLFYFQIYFSDPFFRRLIYSWHPVDNFVVPIGEKVNIEELMLCLQRLFVTLQVTPYVSTCLISTFNSTRQSRL